SGKSTILGLVLGFLAPDDGTVRLGGRVVTGIPDAELRPALVSGLTQDAYVFRGSIRSNLTLARPDAGDEEVWAALDEAGAAGWVRGLPSGVDTVLGPDGATVSGGERQRLALATVLLARPGLLVLDEPMESLDRELADRVLDRLLGGGRTVLLTSHRLVGLEGADEIVVLGEGGVRDRGTHAELLARPGYYRDRYEAERRALDLAAAMR
ncbi:MAG: ATP-binding cassette domain-containing protein, partial [Acidimicrobiales bacterium]